MPSYPKACYAEIYGSLVVVDARLPMALHVRLTFLRFSGFGPHAQRVDPFKTSGRAEVRCNRELDGGSTRAQTSPKENESNYRFGSS
jgi:hypothetical protein